MNFPDAAPVCTHCRLPIPAGARVPDRAGGRDLAFCCRGCQGAYRIITGAGLGAFYEQRRWTEPGTPEGAFEAAWDEAYLSRFVTAGGGGLSELSVLVEGIRCASCIWVLERILGRLPGVREARVSFATHRARILFDPARASPRRLFEAIARVGYFPRPHTPGEVEQQARAERRTLLIRFGTAAFLSMQLMGYSLALYAGYFQGMDPDSRRMLHGLAWAVATPVVFYSGLPFLRGAVRSLANRAPDMDLLVALGVLSAYGYSAYAALSGQEVYFETAATIVTLILLGRLLEAGARRRASAGIDRLLRLAPDTAHREEAGSVREVDAATLAPGHRVIVRPGERFPTDGTVLSGATDVDESAVTGEPLPALRSTGDRVTSGTVNLTAAVTVEVGATAADSFVGRIARLVEEAQSRRAPVQALADRVSAAFVPLVLLLAASTLGWAWLRGLAPAEALLRAVAVLVVACPCALGLATPMAILVGVGAAAGRGVLFRGGDVMEALAHVTVAAFDKTGTLTQGRPRVAAVESAAGDESALLRVAAWAESGSGHPLARAIVAEALGRGIDFPTGVGAQALPGRGVALPSSEGEILAGSGPFLRSRGVEFPEADVPGGLTEVHLARAGRYEGRILLEDPPRPDAAEALRELRALGIRTALLTGDSRTAADRVAAQTGIGTVEAEALPEDKARWVRAAEEAGERVLMVGDGINDAPALTAASVGCAMAGGTDAALGVSDLVLTRADLARIPVAIAIARRTLAVVRQNLAWAFVYNLAALPLAMSGRLAPVYAAAAMSLSSLCVVGNSLRLVKGGWNHRAYRSHRTHRTQSSWPAAAQGKEPDLEPSA